MHEFPPKYDTPKRNADTAVGIALVCAGVVQVAYAVAMLAVFFVGASLQIGGIVVKSVVQLNSSNADIRPSAEHAAIVNAALNIGIHGAVLAIALTFSGVLALLHKRSAIWPAAISAIFCLNLFTCHFAMDWFGFAMIYLALDVSLIAYATYVFRQPRVFPMPDTQANPSDVPRQWEKV